MRSSAVKKTKSSAAPVGEVIDDMKFALQKPPRAVQVDAVRRIRAAFDEGFQYVVLEGPPGCHARGAEILMHSGEAKRVEDIRVGDKVMGPDSSARTVRQLCRGTMPMVRVKPTKGDAFDVTWLHTLSLVRAATGAVTKDGLVTDVAVHDWAHWSNTQRHHGKLFRVGVNFEEAKLPLDPYFLGVLLGDGAITQGVRVCKPDQELWNACRPQAALFGLNFNSFAAGDGFSISQSRGGGKSNPISTILKELGVYGLTSGERFIPSAYRVGSRAQRLGILAGLLDTDGSLANGCYDYISMSKRLARDVTFVARSLGFAAYLTPCEKYCQTGGGGTYYRVCISGALDQIPCHIPRKKAGARLQKKSVLRTGFTVEPQQEKADYYGFQVDEDHRYVMGDFTVTHNSGKTAMAMTLAAHYGPTYICTVTKQLQEQYMRDFSHLRLEVLKGRSSFRCDRARDTCAVGGVFFQGRDACGDKAGENCRCPYKDAKARALAAPVTVCNYSSFLYNVDEDEPRELLVLDEGHETEAVLMDYISVSINAADTPVVVPERLPAVGQPVAAYFAWLDVLKRALDKRRQAGLSPEELASADRLAMKVHFVLKHKAAEEWIVERDEKKEAFSLKPLTVRSFGGRLFHHAKRVLIMSATILDSDAVTSSLGIDSAQVAFVQLPCTFPVENRPVMIGNLRMTYAAREESWPIMVRYIEGVLGHHATQKGLLLAPSNAMLQFIMKNIDSRLARRLLMAYGDNREAKMREHLASSSPTVLAASGMWEGIDLAFDASRFQIIPALPRPHWSGQVMERAKIDPRWYTWKTLTQLLQGIGRSVRSETDSACTYVLDGALRQELAKGDNSMLPQWFKAACRLTGG